MEWIKNFKFFKENKENKVSNKNLISEICISMVLLNNEFLDDIIDRGQKARYSENSEVFLTDLKNLLLVKNRLKLGIFVEDKFVEDSNLSKINSYFNSVEFNIEKDWNKLVKARNISRAIIDKLIPDEKLTQEQISTVYWIGPNKNSDIKEDIVLELNNGKQYSFFLNKNISLQKTASFSTFADDLIGDNIDFLFKEDNISKWDKLTQEWIKIIYENSSKDIQRHIEKFIDTKRIDSIGYFEYFDIRHRDPKFKHLGEYIKEFGKNILKLSDLLNEVWKDKNIYFLDEDVATKNWYETKITILNSRILEHLFTTSLKRDKIDEIDKVDDGYKMSSGTVKMKLMKTIVDKMNCLERPVYYISNTGDEFIQIPDREFFRENYDKIDILFDYHVSFKVSEDEEDNNFNFKIKLIFNEKELMRMNIIVGFSGGEFSGKLNAKYKYEIPEDFNFQISK